jgi:hypothetical protein
MTPSAEESNLATILYRLDSLDKRLERMEGSVERLAFVSLDLYRSEQSAQNERIDSAVKLAMWALGLVCSVVVAGLLGLLVKLATA